MEDLVSVHALFQQPCVMARDLTCQSTAWTGQSSQKINAQLNNNNAISVTLSSYQDNQADSVLREEVTDAAEVGVEPKGPPSREPQVAVTEPTARLVERSTRHDPTVAWDTRYTMYTIYRGVGTC